MRNILRELSLHKWALGMALVCGVIVSAPSFLAERAIGADYKGVPFLFQDAETVYLTRIHEIEDGHPTVSSPVLHEYKDARSIVPPIDEWVYEILSKVTSASIVGIVLASKLLFPALLFLLIYALAYLLLRDAEAEERDAKLTAISAATFIILGYDLVDVHTALALLKSPSTSFHLSIWTRLVNPITGALFLFGCLLSLWKLVKGSRLAPYFAALCLALSIGYIFSFGIALAFIGLLALVAIGQKEWSLLKKLCLVVLGALLLNIPYLVSVLSTTSGSQSSNAYRNGLLLTHKPLFSTVLVTAIGITLAGLAYDRYRKRDFKLYSPQLFTATLLLGALGAMNQQVITGRTIWPAHFVQFTIPLSIFAGFVFLFVYIRPVFPRIFRAVLVAAMLSALLFSLRMVPTYKNELADYRTANRYESAFAWLDQSTKQGECVVLPAEGIEGMMDYYITAFTHCDVYLSLYTFSSVPEDRILHNYLVYLAFQGVKPNEVLSYVKSHKRDIQITFFRDWADLFFGNNDKWLSSIKDKTETEAWIDSTETKVAKSYQEFMSSGLKQGLLKYRLDYVIWDRQANPNWVPPLPLKEVFRENDISIYTIN